MAVGFEPTTSRSVSGRPTNRAIEAVGTGETVSYQVMQADQITVNYLIMLNLTREKFYLTVFPMSQVSFFQNSANDWQRARI